MDLYCIGRADLANAMLSSAIIVDILITLIFIYAIYVVVTSANPGQDRRIFASLFVLLLLIYHNVSAVSIIGDIAR